MLRSLMKRDRARRVIAGGRGKSHGSSSLIGWLQDLLSGSYDQHLRGPSLASRLVARGNRSRSNIYECRLSRLRRGLVRAIDQNWLENLQALPERRLSLNTLPDLDLRIVEDAYQSEYRASRSAASGLAAIGQMAGHTRNLHSPPRANPRTWLTAIDRLLPTGNQTRRRF